jgi:hypothetical protein
MNHRGNPRAARGTPAENSGLAGMGVNDIGLDLAQEPHQITVRANIPDRVDRSPHFIKDNHAVALALGALQQRAFGADRRAGDQRDIMPQLVLSLTGKDGVLLRPTDDQPGNDVDDLQINRSAIWTALVAAPLRT